MKRSLFLEQSPTAQQPIHVSLLEEHFTLTIRCAPTKSKEKTKLKHYDHHPYLGVEIAQDLNWGEHIKATTTKAHRCLNLLCRNLSGCSRETKDKAYNTMVRPILEFAGAVWDPYQSNHIDMLEKVRCKGSRFVCSDYSSYSSVSGMMSTLDLRSLQERLFISRLGMFYQAHHHPGITIRRHVASHHTSRWPNPEQGPVITSNTCHLRSTWTLTSLAFSPDVSRPGTSYHHQ